MKVDYAGSFDSREVDKVHLVRLGVKVAVDFGWCKKSRKVEEKTSAPV